MVPAKKRMIRVLVADDHAVVRSGVEQALAGHEDVELAGEGAGSRCFGFRDPLLDHEGGDAAELVDDSGLRSRRVLSRGNG